MEHLPQFSDTDARALQVWMDILSAKTPGERIAMALDMTQFALRLAESGVRERYPRATEREVFLRSASLRIPRHLMIRAYGWDPEEH